jgi:hypothetical protein
MKLHMTQTRITGKAGWHCRIGAADFYAPTKKEIETAVWGWMQEASRPPQVALVSYGVELRLIVSHAGQTSTYKPADESRACGKYAVLNGIVLLANTCLSNWDIKAQAESELQNLKGVKK